MHTASLEVRHDCAIGKISQELPDIEISRWCLSGRDLYLVRGPHDQVETFKSSIDGKFGILHDSEVAQGVSLITHRDCRDPGYHFFMETGGMGLWDVPPVIYSAGWERWRVISRGRTPLRLAVDSMRRVGEVKIASVGRAHNFQITSMLPIPASKILGGLTPRQISTLLLGIDRGYFALPSETNVATLASEVGLSRSTFGEHLRKAEAHIFSNLRPYLQGFDLKQACETSSAAPGIARADETDVETEAE